MRRASTSLYCREEGLRKADLRLRASRELLRWGEEREGLDPRSRLADALRRF